LALAYSQNCRCAECQNPINSPYPIPLTVLPSNVMTVLGFTFERSRMDPPGTVKFLMWMSVHDETAALTAAAEYVPIVQTGSVEVVVLYLARGDQWRHWRAVQPRLTGLELAQRIHQRGQTAWLSQLPAGPTASYQTCHRS
jgi:hypothetical protein